MSFLGAIFGLFLFFAGFVWLGKKLGHPFLGFFTGVILVIIAYIIMRNNENVGTILLFIGPVISIIFIISMIVKAILVTKEKVEEKIEEKQQQQINNDLLEAVKSGDAQAAQQLLEYGADANYSNSIKIAVENGNKEIVSLLIESGADINKENPLVIAVRNNNKEIVELLLEKGAKVNSIYDGKSLLDMASDKEIIKILKNHGAKTKAEIDEERAEQYELDLALCNAVANKDIETVMSLISKGADANFIYDRGSSHIQKLASDIVDFPNISLGCFIPILFLAIKNNDIEMITYLRAKGADVLFDAPCLYWSDYFAEARTHINAIDLARDVYKNEKLAQFLENGE